MVPKTEVVSIRLPVWLAQYIKNHPTDSARTIIERALVAWLRVANRQ